MNLDRNAKLERLKAAIERQRRFLGSVPDPDNRERAEANLMTLIFLRDELEQEQEHGVAEIVVKWSTTIALARAIAPRPDRRRRSPNDAGRRRSRCEPWRAQPSRLRCCICL